MDEVDDATEAGKRVIDLTESFKLKPAPQRLARNLNLAAALSLVIKIGSEHLLLVSESI